MLKQAFCEQRVAAAADPSRRSICCTAEGLQRAVVCGRNAATWRPAGAHTQPESEWWMQSAHSRTWRSSQGESLPPDWPESRWGTKQRTPVRHQAAAALPGRVDGPGCRADRRDASGPRMPLRHRIVLCRLGAAARKSPEWALRPSVVVTRPRSSQQGSMGAGRLKNHATSGAEAWSQLAALDAAGSLSRAFAARGERGSTNHGRRRGQTPGIGQRALQSAQYGHATVE